VKSVSGDVVRLVGLGLRLDHEQAGSYFWPEVRLEEAWKTAAHGYTDLLEPRFWTKASIWVRNATNKNLRPRLKLEFGIKLGTPCHPAVS